MNKWRPNIETKVTFRFHTKYPIDWMRTRKIIFFDTNFYYFYDIMMRRHCLSTLICIFRFIPFQSWKNKSLSILYEILTPWSYAKISHVKSIFTEKLCPLRFGCESVLSFAKHKYIYFIFYGNKFHCDVWCW
jgi:hypothetical protein